MEQKPRSVSPFSNDARNTYVIEHITASLLKILKEKPIADITIKEICDDAGVGRTSFYRNFETKEDIVKRHIDNLLLDWKCAYEQSGKDSLAEIYSSLFGHLKENDGFYLLLKRRNLMHLLLSSVIALHGINDQDVNLALYVKSFIAYGTYGWIEAWITRGMQESAEEMAAMLMANGMK